MVDGVVQGEEVGDEPVVELDDGVHVELGVHRVLTRGVELVETVLDAQGLGRLRAVGGRQRVDAALDLGDELVDRLVLIGHFRPAGLASEGDEARGVVALHLDLVREGGQPAGQHGDLVDLCVVAGARDRGRDTQTTEHEGGEGRDDDQDEQLGAHTPVTQGETRSRPSLDGLTRNARRGGCGPPDACRGASSIKPGSPPTEGTTLFTCLRNLSSDGLVHEDHVMQVFAV